MFPHLQYCVCSRSCDPCSPAVTPAAAAAPSFGLAFFIDLLLFLLLLLLLQWLRCSTGSPVQAGRASLGQVFADRLEATRVSPGGVRSNL